jgi:carboxypeptidase PM20D1
LSFIEKTVDDPRIEIRAKGEGANASRVSSDTSEGYTAIAATAGLVYGDAIVGPGMTVAATDSRHYGRVADDSYRFNPMVVTPADITGFHGTNESISVKNMGLGTTFYAELIKISAGN